MKTRHTKSKQNSITLAFGTTLGVIVSILITLLLAGIAAILVLNGSVPDSTTPYICIAILFISCFVGAYLGGKTVEDKKLISCVFSGSMYFLVILAAKILVFEGAYTRVIPTIISILVGIGLATILILKPKRQRTGKKIGKIRI